MGRRSKRRADPDEAPGGGRSGLPARIVGAGPRVVLLHGGPGLDHHILLPFAEQLAEELEVWLPDLPGHGARASGPAPSLADTVQRVEGWLLKLGGAVDVLAGHSLGAWVAREILRAGRVRPRAAVLVAPPAGDRGQAPVAWPRVQRQRRMSEAEARRALLAEVRAETGAEPSAAFVAAVQAAHLRPPSEHHALLKSSSLALGKPTPRCRPPCPVLVISHEDDPVVTPHRASCVASATAGAELSTLPGRGHVPAATGDDTLARHVRAFVRRHLRT